ncbi:FAD:protein FMN transferase [Planctomicrobium sp.]|nr:FAD:protein FMN transferase [Planctomicrobium sp.]MDB4733659.1 FAD:protein FMN transferase [Planctomicrobium sp.]
MTNTLQVRKLSLSWVWWVVWGTSLFLLTRTPVIGAEKLKRYEFLQIRMGIPVNITLYAPSEAIANQASKAAYDQFRKIDSIMSDYDPDSELMQLCKNAAVAQPVGVSPELFEVLTEAQKLSQQTDGAFDVTVGPVVKLWRIARRREELPDPQRLAKAMESVGYQNIELKKENRSVILKKANMQIDLGAIAKGYAADQALKAMKAHGISKVLIDAGGDIVAGDSPPGREFWMIEIEKLQSESDAETPIVHLNNAAIATSGDAYQFLEIDGARYSHIVNPLTGKGLTTTSTVTVIAPTGMAADRLASAVSVLGAQKGLELIQRNNKTELFMFTLDAEGEISATVSDGFSKYFAAQHISDN